MKRFHDINEDSTDLVCCDGKPIRLDMKISDMGIYVYWTCKKCGKQADFELTAEDVVEHVRVLLDRGDNPTFYDKEGEEIKDEELEY